MSGVLDPRPGRRRLRGHEALFSHRGRGVRHPEILVHRPQNLTGQGHPHPSEFPILRVHSGVVVLTSHGRKAPTKTQHPQGQVGETVGTVPVLRGETTSPWRKPHGPCERVRLQVTNIQAGAATPPQRRTSQLSPAVQPPEGQSSAVLLEPAGLQAREKQSQQRSASLRGEVLIHCPRLRSSDLLSRAAREEDRKINDISLTAHRFAPIFSQSFLLTCRVLFWYDIKTAHINMTRALSAIINPHNQEPAFDLDIAIKCRATCQDVPNNANGTSET